MEKDDFKKTGASQTKDARLTQKEFYSEMVCRLYLKGLSYKQIADKIVEEHDKRLDIRTVAKYITDAVKKWQAKKDQWAQEITVLELEKINVLEAEYWAAYERSKLPIKTKKTKIEPVQEKPEEESGEKKKRSRAKPKVPVIPGFKILEEVREEREQIGNEKFLTGVQWCIERRLEILGHTGAIKNDITKPKSGDDKAKPLTPGRRTISFVRAAANSDIILNSNPDNDTAEQQ